jgi:hypothetical protein
MKLPLEATIAGGYRFLFGRILSIIGTLWFPYALLFGVGGLLLYAVLPHGVFHGDFSEVGLATLMNPQVQAARLLVTVMAWLAAAMTTVQLMRHALGLKESTTFIFFSLAGLVWRMLVAFILGVLLLIPVILVLVLAGAGAGAAVALGAASHLQWWQTAAIIVALIVVAIALFIYVIARLFFFLPAVVVAEEKIGLGRSWELGKGNILRIVAVWLCIALPIWIVMSIVVGATVLPVVFSGVLQLPPKPTPEQLRPLLSAILRFVPVILPVGIAAGIAVRGYMAGAIGTAYKAVTAAKQESA